MWHFKSRWSQVFKSIAIPEDITSFPWKHSWNSIALAKKVVSGDFSNFPKDLFPKKTLDCFSVLPQTFTMKLFWLKAVNYFCKKLHLRYLTGFWICLCMILIGFNGLICFMEQVFWEISKTLRKTNAKHLAKHIRKDHV